MPHTRLLIPPVLAILIGLPVSQARPIAPLDSVLVIPSGPLEDVLVNDGMQIVIQQQRLRLHRFSARADGKGIQVWQGILLEPESTPPSEGSIDAALNAATLILRNGRLTGSLRWQGEAYRLDTVAGRKYRLTHVPEAAHMALDHGPAGDRLAMDMTSVAALDEDTSTAVIRVLVVGTTPARKAYDGDLHDLVVLEIEESNQTFKRSGIDIRLELAAYVPVEYTPIGGEPHATNALMGKDDGHLDEVHPLRDRVSADVVVMLSEARFGENERQPWCGWAARVVAAEDSAFANVNWRCLAGRYSFVHEIGHLIGAAHDNETSTDHPMYRFAHGYRHEPGQGGGWRTLMSYDCVIRCPRLGYWSNPDVLLDGVPMGDRVIADNHRALQLRRHIVAGFR